ncbi:MULTISPECIES: alpha/beta hydrolase [Agathobacter]|nr:MULTISPECIES: alpha/beta fold hydrolase [Agathobacter]MDC7300635.1 lysophospholipase [Agathobacter ruminis]
MMMMEEMELWDDGIRLHVKIDFPKAEAAGGKYPMCIVLHGFTGDMEERHIVAVQEAMNEIGMATLRVELYGHGSSGGEFRNHNLYKWLNNVMTVIDYAKTREDVSDLYLCGHSQGGLTAMLAAAMEREVIKALIPLSPAIVITDRAKHGELLGLQFDNEHIPDEVESWDGRKLSGNYLRVARTIDVDAAIAQYSGPVLIVHGDEDEAVPVTYGIEAAKKYANATLKLIAHDNHCYDYHLDQVTAAVKEFLQQELG